MRKGWVIALIWLLIIGSVIGGWYLYDNSEGVIRSRIEERFSLQIKGDVCDTSGVEAFPLRSDCLNGAECAAKKIAESIGKEDLKEFDEKSKNDINDKTLESYFDSDYVQDCFENNGWNRTLIAV